VRATTRERILDFYRRHYTPEAMTLIAVGDVPLASVCAWAEELLGGDWGRPRATGRHRPPEPARTGRRIHLVPDEAKEAWLNVSFAIPPPTTRTSPRWTCWRCSPGRADQPSLPPGEACRPAGERISAYAYPRWTRACSWWG
jgi:hypothetical protein